MFETDCSKPPIAKKLQKAVTRHGSTSVLIGGCKQLSCGFELFSYSNISKTLVSFKKGAINDPNLIKTIELNK